MSETDSGPIYLTVRAAAERLGVTPRTMKYYEERGLVQPSRSEGRYRLYDDNDLERFSRILRLRDIGFSLQTITEVLKQPLVTPEGGREQLSAASLREIQCSLQNQVSLLDKRIASVRKELKETQAVRQELEYDLAYVAGRLSGESIDALLEQRHNAVLKPSRTSRRKPAGS